MEVGKWTAQTEQLLLAAQAKVEAVDMSLADGEDRDWVEDMVLADTTLAEVVRIQEEG